MKIQVLDFGYVEFIEAWGTGKSGLMFDEGGIPYRRDVEVGIIEAARQSTQKGFISWKEDFKLLKYLKEHKHDTPFEFAGLVLEIQAPIFVFREWHRHRTQCLSADSVLSFDAPDGTVYQQPISEIVRKWNPTPAQKRQRAKRTITQWNRERINGMRLRSDAGHVSVTDAWHSGAKPVFRVITDYGELRATSDHLFKTPNGCRRIADSIQSVMMVKQVGKPIPTLIPRFSGFEIRGETWKMFSEGYEVSDLGRIRSYHTTRGMRNQPKLKAVVINPSGRAVVGVQGKAVQVSKLVWDAFHGGNPPQVLHRDGNAGNNRKSNLYGGDDSENARDRIKHDAQTRLREIEVPVRKIVRSGVQETFDITVTGNHLFVANGFVVHNSYNEMSARYAPLPDLYYLPESEDLWDRALKSILTKNKQAGSETKGPPSFSAIKRWLEVQIELYQVQEEHYRIGLDIGIPKEVARIGMPVGHYSRMRAHANLRNWLHFLTLRLDPAAQQEIRSYAGAVAEIISRTFPMTWGLAKEQMKSEV